MWPTSYCQNCGEPNDYPVLSCPKCSKRGVTLVNLDDIKREEEKRNPPPGPKPLLTKLVNAVKVFLLDSRIRAFLDKTDPKSVEQATEALKPFEPSDEYKDSLKLSRMDCYAGKQRAEVNAYDPELQLEDGINAPPYIWLQFVEGCGYTVYTVTPDEAEELAVMLFKHAQVARHRHEHRHDPKETKP